MPFDNYTINVDMFQIKSVQKALEKSMYIKDNLDDAFNNAIEELQSRTLVRLEEEIIRYGLEGSGLSGTVTVKRRWDGLEIIANSQYAMYVEFGTGIVGSDNPHPDTGSVSWTYDINSHFEEGWWYPTTEDDPNPTKRYDEMKQHWFAWTKGSAARPFMYNTYRYLKLIAVKTINKHINKLVDKK